MAEEYPIVPNQRYLYIHKVDCDRQHLYTVNNLDAISEAAKNLQTKAGFKLYMYFAKNQHLYHFQLSSSHFCEWAGCGIKAYSSAFEELVDKGYLMKSSDSTERFPKYDFYDKSKKPKKLVKDKEIDITINKQ